MKWLVMLLGLALVIAPALGAPAGAGAWSRVLDLLPTVELRDVDCDRVQGGLVRWPDVRTQVQRLDEAWREKVLPKETCHDLEIELYNSEVRIVLARSVDAASECALGALAAVMVMSICFSDCGTTAPPGADDAAETFTTLWRSTLAGPTSLPAYMLGTTSWPIASLLAKWQAHCALLELPANGGDRGGETSCALPEVQAFSNEVQEASEEHLLPMLWRPDEASAPDISIGMHARRWLPALANFMNSGAAQSDALPTECRDVVIIQDSLLVLLRLLGPPAYRDPLHGQRLVEFGERLAHWRFADVIRAPWTIAAVLAISRHLTWRSHRLYGGGKDVSFADIRRVLEMGIGCLSHTKTQPDERHGRFGTGLLESLHDDAVARHQLWKQVEGPTGLGALWAQIARWLLAGEVAGVDTPDSERQAAGASPASPVYFTMGFGQIDFVWLRGFFERALDVGLPRLVFVTPDRSWLLFCEEVRRERQAEHNLLCIRPFIPFSRPYDFNNKAKFYLFPIFLSFGIDIVWLDLDIFVFQSPTERLLEQAYEDAGGPKDVLVTDHFDEHCLNHGVFLVRASDKSLLWILEYIRWMHWYPYGHDQNGWDAFLGHSIVEPQLPEDLRTNPAINVSYGILSTELEYVTLTGWAGQSHQRNRALLLHFTTTQGISGRSKKLRLLALFNATARRPGEAEPDWRRLDMAKWKALRPLQTGLPHFKRPCYEGIHMVVGALMTSGLYDELLA